jgi:hypothetical protein
MGVNCGWKITEATRRGGERTVKYNANTEVWMKMIVFTEFLRALDVRMGVQSRKILMFLDNCGAHLQDSLFLRNVKVAYYPSNCTSML